MTARTLRPLALFAALLAALFLSSCTSTEQQSDGHTDHTHSENAGGDAGDAQAPHNADDITFARDMTPHHQQALELVDLARDRSSDPALLELASGIAAAQGPEMEKMSAMLRSWGQDPGSGMDHSGHGMAMPGMVDDATMQRLESLSGREFDTLWLESMISHHQGAVEMAKAEIANGANPEAKALAEEIIKAQEAEIAQMKQMLEG
ncbi:DUF305 domain-containing protein [Mycolicibacterium litorale]|uniref:DUF305 domain-containing protein n=1 Tax=Mycolicibacterium litorale TaxID=758802 RepID=A0AAD1IMH6_9MYCO|nr:DUF305 domain-containing protein [Mycolicibacterium litorale]MCV7417212.1 DUF305 domain-containing protein [Mycolicibacterium litorale]TDY05000.1 uncharacterized protein (DUF305 family) [Mycolicibacterium litorale]BBY18430.1 hypothetical protein MLIT_40220 [Mycolicibacterium litorale]